MQYDLDKYNMVYKVLCVYNMIHYIEKRPKGNTPNINIIISVMKLEVFLKFSTPQNSVISLFKSNSFFLLKLFLSYHPIVKTFLKYFIDLFLGYIEKNYKRKKV